MDLYCDCGKVSDVKTVSKNGASFGRQYYCCSSKTKAEGDGCNFFLFVVPSQHYVDLVKVPTKKAGALETGGWLVM